MLVARILGKAPFGQLGLVQRTLGMFGALAGFGTGTGASKFVAEFRLTNAARAGRIIALSSVVSWSSGIALAAVLFVLAPRLANGALAHPDESGDARLCCTVGSPADGDDRRARCIK